MVELLEGMFCGPVIKENTAHEVATHQNNILLLWRTIYTLILWCLIIVKLSIVKKIIGLEIMTLNHEKV